MILRTISISLLLASLGGCASTPAFRDLAFGTGEVVQNLQVGTEQFAREQTALNARNAANLDRLGLETNRARSEALRQEMAWAAEAGGGPSLRYSRATSVSAEEIVASLSARSVQWSPVIASGSKEYEAAQENLATLSTEPSSIVALGSVLTFGGAVQTALEGLREKARTESNAAAASTTAAATATIADAAGD